MGANQSSPSPDGQGGKHVDMEDERKKGHSNRGGKPDVAERHQEEAAAAAQGEIEFGEEEEEDDDDDDDDDDDEGGKLPPHPAHLSSATTTGRVSGPTVRVWQPAGGSHQRRGSAAPSWWEGEVCTRLYVVRCGESNLGPGLDGGGAHVVIGGRRPSTVLTAEGHRQARALGAALVSRGVRLDAVCASPLERCKQTAFIVSQELSFPQESIEFSEAISEMSHGLWEGLQKHEVYTNEVVNAMASLGLDFHAPGGESHRQVEFRVVEFLNNVVLPRSLGEASNYHVRHKDVYYLKQKNSNATSMILLHGGASEGKKPTSSTTHSNLLVKEKGKSRAHVTPQSGRVGMPTMASTLSLASFENNMAYNVAFFSHEKAIKCLLRGLLGSSSNTIDRINIHNASLTILKHSTYFGWEIEQVNDVTHLRVLL